MSQYEHFQKNILGYEKDDNIEKHVKSIYNESLIRRVILSNIILFIIHVLYLIIEMTSKDFYKEYGYTNLYGVLIVFASTIISTIILRTELDESGKVCRITILSNLILLTVAFSMFTYTSYEALISSGASLRLELVGIPMGSLLLVLLIITPLYYRIDTSILWLAIIVEYLVLYFSPVGQVMDLFNTIVFRVIILFMSLFYRFQIKAHAFSRINIEDLSYKLSYKVYSDSTNTTLNRVAMHAYFDRVKYNKEVNSLGIMLINVNDYTPYVLKNGHVNGIKLVQNFGKLLDENFDNTYVFKFDRDKFVLAFEDTNKEKLLEFSNKVITISEEIKKDLLSVTISSKIVSKKDDLNNVIDYNFNQIFALNEENKNISIDGEVF